MKFTLFLIASVCFGENLVQNSSFQNVEHNLPRHWAPSQWGSNHADFNLLLDSSNGKNAVQVTVTDYIDGDAKWVSDSVPMRPHTRYVYVDRYKASTESIIVLQYETGPHQYQYLQMGDWTFEKSDDWKEAKISIVPPITVRRFVVFHLLRSNGSLTISNPSIQTVPILGFREPLISLNFDDGYESGYTNGIKSLSRHNIKSTAFIVTNFLNQKNYVDDDELSQMQTNGVEIGFHGLNHDDLTVLTEEMLARELHNDLKSVAFAFPYGHSTEAVRAKLPGEGFQFARTTTEGYNAVNTNPYELFSQGVNSNTTFEQVKVWIDTARRDNTWLILVFHKVDYSGDMYSTTPEMIAQIADYINQTKIKVVSLAEAMKLGIRNQK